VIINVTGGPDMALMEVNEALTVIQEAAHEEANIIFGAVVDPALAGKVKITVIATGFDHVPGMRSAPAAAPMQTPVDLHSYSTHLSSSRQSAGAVAASGDTTLSGRLTISRRPAIDLPPPATRMARGAGGMETPAERTGTEPGFELDVPAFLRRSEG
jgi:cell division protein FtsZ